MKIEESLNVAFDETPPPSKTSPLVDDDLDEEEAIKVTKKKNLENDIEDETLEVYEIVNIKKSKNHPLDNVIGNLNQRTLRFDDVLIVCNNKGVIDLRKNPVQHLWMKHIEIHHHFLRDNVQKGNISIDKVLSEDNIVDILTKLLKRESFYYRRLGLGMMKHIP
ncbi:hypothetical protein Tco_1455923 [Tanacetum coccineum]